MAVNLDDLLVQEEVKSRSRQSDAAQLANNLIQTGAASYLAILDRVMLREYTEPSFAEAMAMREAGGSADAQRLASLQAAAGSPRQGMDSTTGTK